MHFGFTWKPRDDFHPSPGPKSTRKVPKSPIYIGNRAPDGSRRFRHAPRRSLAPPPPRPCSKLAHCRLQTYLGPQIAPRSAGTRGCHVENGGSPPFPPCPFGRICSPVLQSSCEWLPDGGGLCRYRLHAISTKCGRTRRLKVGASLGNSSRPARAIALPASRLGHAQRAACAAEAAASDLRPPVARVFSMREDELESFLQLPWRCRVSSSRRLCRHGRCRRCPHLLAAARSCRHAS